MWRRSAKVLADLFGTLGGNIEGGLRSVRCDRPGKTSVGVVKKIENPSEK
jgi:hypothetical protein